MEVILTDVVVVGNCLADAIVIGVEVVVADDWCYFYWFIFLWLIADAIFIGVEIVGAIIMIIISEDVGMFLLLMLLLAWMLLLRDAITIGVEAILADVIMSSCYHVIITGVEVIVAGAVVGVQVVLTDAIESVFPMPQRHGGYVGTRIFTLIHYCSLGPWFS